MGGSEPGERVVDKLYEGTIILKEVETRERTSMAVLIAVNGDQVTCTMTPVTPNGGPVTTIQTEPAEESRFLRRLVEQIQHLNVST